MTELLDRAMRAAAAQPAGAQDDLPRMVLFATGVDETVYQLTEDDEIAIAPSRAQAARGEFATDEQMRAHWAEFGL